MNRVLILCASLIIGCTTNTTQNPEPPTNVSLIVDITDSMMLPAADPLLRLYDCNKYPDAECWFSMRSISDKTHNPTTTYHLADAATLEKRNSSDDPQWRAKSILSFYTHIRGAIADVHRKQDTAKALAHSEIYTVLCDELALLAKRQGNRYLLIYSDLFERSAAFDAYAAQNMSPKEIARQLLHYRPLPQQLQGITVFLVYQPRTRSDDQRYTVMSKAYTQMLQERGAQVIIQSDNKQYEL